MIKSGQNTLRILTAAIRALMFRRSPIPTVYGPEISLLVVLNLIVLAFLGIAQTEGDGLAFSARGVSAYLAILALETGILLLASPRKRGVDLAGLVAILLGVDAVAMSVAILATLVDDRALDTLSVPSEVQLFVPGVAGMIWMLWQASAVFLLALRSTTLMPRRFALGVVIASLTPALILPSAAIVIGQGDDWSPGLLQSGFDLIKTKRTASTQPRLKPLNAEAIFARQSQLIDTQLDTLAPSQPNLNQVYFIGMAPYAGQDVFKRELTSAQKIMTERFATGGHSILMVNHRDTLTTLPLATAFNLERILWRLAQVMDRDNDVLVLYITSHGTEGLVSVDMAGLQLDDLKPSDLAELLARTGIRNKVIILSACHSGSFIPALAGPDTLVMTAARADRASFGCSNERDWTYFGDALFNHALRNTHSLTVAFERARALVGTWERQQNLTPASEPQISIGANIATKLEALSQQHDRLAQPMVD
jgi:hypothetical protein